MISTNGLSGRFDRVISHIRGLQSENPESKEIARECELVVAMIRGERPNIEEKYDALLLKLDRSYSHLSDKRDYWKTVQAETPLFQTRKLATAKVKALNMVLCNLVWMKARNRDLIQTIKQPAQPEDA